MIEQMLKNYDVENIYDRKNAMKEIMQEAWLRIRPSKLNLRSISIPLLLTA